MIMIIPLRLGGGFSGAPSKSIQTTISYSSDDDDDDSSNAMNDNDSIIAIPNNDMEAAAPRLRRQARGALGGRLLGGVPLVYVYVYVYMYAYMYAYMYIIISSIITIISSSIITITITIIIIRSVVAQTRGALGDRLLRGVPRRRTATFWPVASGLSKK